MDCTGQHGYGGANGFGTDFSGKDRWAGARLTGTVRNCTAWSAQNRNWFGAVFKGTERPKGKDRRVSALRVIEGNGIAWLNKVVRGLYMRGEQWQG